VLRASRIVLLGGALSATLIVGVLLRERAVGGKSDVVALPADNSPAALPSAPPADEPSVVPKPPTSSRPAAARSPSRAHSHEHASTPRARIAPPPLRNDRLFNPFGSTSRNQ
jgi:hypothetical protein